LREGQVVQPDVHHRRNRRLMVGLIVVAIALFMAGLSLMIFR